MISSIFSSVIVDGTFTGTQFWEITAVSLLCGMIIAAAHSIKSRCSRSFAITLVLLPAIVELVIMLVNGNIGTGIAVAGAFSLVRFRSVPGRGQEITSVFLAMAIGLATGMGYIGVAVIFTVVISAINVIMNTFGNGQGNESHRMLKITIPENIDYEGKFEDVFEKYLDGYTYDEVKTCDMGSLYRMTLTIRLKAGISTKAFLDELRARNGNLEISLGRPYENTEAL